MRGRTTVIIMMVLLGAACSPARTSDTTSSASTTDPSSDESPASSTTEVAPVDPPATSDPPATTDRPPGEPPSEEPTEPAEATEPDDSPQTATSSDVLGVVSLLYAGETLTGDDVERDLGELTRCVAEGPAPATASVEAPDSGEDLPEALDELDPDALAAVTAAMDGCIPPAVVASSAHLDGPIEREQHVEAKCVIEFVGDSLDWATFAAEVAAGNDPFDIDDVFDECGDFGPSGDVTLRAEEEVLVDSLDDLADIVGFELSGDETNCVVDESRGSIDPGVAVDLSDLDAFVAVFDALDTCVPLGGLLAEFDEGAIVYSMCLDRTLAGTVGWSELAELGARAEDLTDEQLATEPVIVAVDDARGRCHRSEPGEVLADLDEVLDVDVLVHDGAALWVGGVDERGGAEPGNLLVLDGATGGVLAAIETEPFSIDIITAGQDHAWVASSDGETIQRVAGGVAAAPVQLTGRAVGDLQLTDGALWATDNRTGALVRLDAETGEVLDEISIAPGEWFSSDLALAAGWLWLTNREDPVVRQLDPVDGSLQAEHLLESEFTMNLLDLGDSVGVYGFSQLWRIDPTVGEPEQLIDGSGQEDIDVEAAVAVGSFVAFADEDLPTLAVYDPSTRFIEQTRFLNGLIGDDRDQMTSNGSTVWLVTFDDRLIRLDTS